MMEDDPIEAIHQNTVKDLKIYLHKSLKINKKMI